MAQPWTSMGCGRSGWIVQGDAASNHTTLSGHLQKLGNLRLQKLTRDEPIHLLTEGTDIVNSSQLPAESGVVVSCETIWQRCQKFGPRKPQNLRQRKGRLGDIWQLDEFLVNTQGRRFYLWRAVDQDGDVIDILVQEPRNAGRARRFFRKLLKGQGTMPSRLVTDGLTSDSVAHREVMPSVTHDSGRYASNWADVSHQATRQRERQMRRLKSSGQARRFPVVHRVVQNPFRLGRHHLQAENYRWLRDLSFRDWKEVTAA